MDKLREFTLQIEFPDCKINKKQKENMLDSMECATVYCILNNAYRLCKVVWQIEF